MLLSGVAEFFRDTFFVPLKKIFDIIDDIAKGENMNFFEKLGKLLASNIAYTVILVFGLILFLYFADGDLIGGIFTAISALVVYVCIALLYSEYKKMPKTAKATVKPVAKKKTTAKHKK